ncbi:MAG: DUF6982 domain-containing protein [Thermodesulfobacteriota bacterium]
MKPVKVIVRYVDGRRLKGYTQDFFPNKSLFHLQIADNPPGSESIEISMKDLKAVFFVREFEGNPQYQEKKTFPPGQKIAGRLVEVTFKDGEVLRGSTLGYDPNRPGFFFFPADPDSNNLRVFAIFQAIRRIQFIGQDKL